MKMRIAKKVYSIEVPDPARKPSASTPYNDRQWKAAGRRYWQALVAWQRMDPSMTSTPKWEPVRSIERVRLRRLGSHP